MIKDLKNKRFSFSSTLILEYVPERALFLYFFEPRSVGLERDGLGTSFEVR